MTDNQHHKGLIHLYTGNGKGKTTAALGLALRAAGAGKKIFIAQFVKGMHYSELDALKRFPEIEIHQFGLDCFITKEPTSEDIEAALRGLSVAENIALEGKHDVLILDEICIALYYKLFDIERLIKLLKTKPNEMEIIMTGRYAPDELIDISDLVTEMKEVKHYYQLGIVARKGIEF
jgi:cob(I)alamin adenosyltransferase